MTNVLLLGADFQPIAVIGPRRALGLVMAEKAEPVQGEPEFEMKSPSRTVHLPTVIRLRYYVRVPQRGAHWSKTNVLRRDKYVCQFCGVKMREDEATVDHVISQAECQRNGVKPNTWGNTVAACLKCQRRKRDRSMTEAGMKFFNPNYEPKQPRVNYLVLLVQNSRHEEWRKYVRA